MAETRRCEAPGCAVSIARGRLMCRQHWFQVPKPLRDGVWHWWGRVINRSLSDQERVEAVAEYRKVSADAVKSVAEKEAAR